MKKVGLALMLIGFLAAGNVQAAPLGASKEEMDYEGCMNHFMFPPGDISRDAAEKFCKVALAKLPTFWKAGDYKTLKGTRAWQELERKYTGESYRTTDEELYAMDILCTGKFVIGHLACLLKHKAKEHAAKEKLPYPVKYWRSEMGGINYVYIDHCSNDGQGYTGGSGCVMEKMRKKESGQVF